MPKPTKNLSTPELRKFWKHVEKMARKVKKWPAWKRHGLEKVFNESNSNRDS